MRTYLINEHLLTYVPSFNSDGVPPLRTSLQGKSLAPNNDKEVKRPPIPRNLIPSKTPLLNFW